MYFSASLNKGRKSACLFVMSPMTGCKDIKHSLIGPGKFQRTNLARTGFWKWNRSCDWLITVKECGSVVSSRFFGGSIAWHPKKRLRRRLGITCGPIWGSFPVWGSFAALYRPNFVPHGNWYYLNTERSFKTQGHAPLKHFVGFLCNGGKPE